MSSFVVILMSLSGAPGDFGGVPRIDAVPASCPLFLLARPRLPRNPRLNFHRPGGGVEVVVFVGALIDGLELAQQNVGIEAVIARQHRADFGDARPDDRLAP